MPGPLFKRWAPPKKSITKQSSSVASSPESAPIPNSQVCHSPEGSQDKKSKKSKKRVIEDSEPVQTEKGEDVEAVLEETSADTPKSIKKQKKRKLDLDVNEAQDEETSKKHKSIFSKFEKVSKRAEVRSKHNEDDNGLDAQENEQVEVLHDLEPLPQPAPVPEPDFEPTFSTLPSWLAHPISVEADRKVPFSELGVHSFYLKKLEKQGFEDALAVQSALLPMLHPGFDQHLGDICVSAKTGSGKTLAYLLPIIEALRDRASPVLSAIIVVPTRQLVDQALQVAEELCTGTKVRVGTAVGSVPLATEQKELVKLRPQYDPQKAKQLHERVSRQFETGFIDRRGFFNDLMSMRTDHIPRYDSGVDILICTPGRLVEHIESTTGFLLNSVQWLVIDEADQLLNQNFQGWATALMDALYEETPDDFKTAQGRLRKREEGFFWDVALPTRRQLTKVVLSATMEKDLTKLATLRLKRPKLVVVQDEPSEEQVLANEGDIFELPSTLDESAVPVNDGQNKPLHLLHLLVHHVFQGIKSTSEEDSSRSESSLDDFPDSSSSSSSSDSSDSSDSSTSDSSESEPDDDNNQAPSIAKHKSRVLIFTKSNESASRLSHLLSILEPSYKDYLKTMTPSSTAKASKKLLRSFSSGVIKILIASDAASRGLDIPDLSHVINYDMPSSITSYVHRVGRTARAGKSGQAWTLFTKTEAAWFWKQIARGNNVLRGGRKVKRVEWKEKDVTADGKKQAYRAALDALEGAVKGSVDTTA